MSKPASFGLLSLDSAGLATLLSHSADKIFGIAAYGTAETPAGLGDIPFSWLDMPVIGGALWYEVWISPTPLRRGKSNGIAYAADREIMYGSIMVDEGSAGLEEATHRAYSQIFDAIDQEGYPHLHRVWNYFPEINAEPEGLERYRSFSVGRYDAFTDKGRVISEGKVPAACALGSHSGKFVVYFIAGKTPGVPCENPRQTNAYRYPGEYGPRSPTFSRAMISGSALLISGTASIIDHRTVHPGNVLMQLEETIANLRAVLAEARLHGFALTNAEGLLLKVYLRHPGYYPEVKKRLEGEFGSSATAVYLHADICRSDLLIEIELFWLPPISRAPAGSL